MAKNNEISSAETLIEKAEETISEKKRLKILQEAASMGSADAYFQLAVIARQYWLEYGNKVNQDAMWYNIKEAVKLDYGPAYYYYGIWLFDETAKADRFEQAGDCFVKAYQHGYVPAAYNASIALLNSVEAGIISEDKYIEVFRMVEEWLTVASCQTGEISDLAKEKRAYVYMLEDSYLNGRLEEVLKNINASKNLPLGEEISKVNNYDELTNKSRTDDEIKRNVEQSTVSNEQIYNKLLERFDEQGELLRLMGIDINDIKDNVRSVAQGLFNAQQQLSNATSKIWDIADRQEAGFDDIIKEVKNAEERLEEKAEELFNSIAEKCKKDYDKLSPEEIEKAKNSLKRFFEEDGEDLWKDVSTEAQKLLITAEIYWQMLVEIRDQDPKAAEYLDCSPIIVSLCKPLEIELARRFFKGPIAYFKWASSQKDGDKYKISNWPSGLLNTKSQKPADLETGFMFGSLIYILYRDAKETKPDIMKDYLVNILYKEPYASEFCSNPRELIFGKIDANSVDEVRDVAGKNNSFYSDMDNLFQYRNRAAHRGQIVYKDASLCRSLMLEERSLLKRLLIFTRIPSNPVNKNPFKRV